MSKTKITKLLSVMLICALVLGMNIPATTAADDNLFPAMVDPASATGAAWGYELNAKSDPTLVQWGADVADAPAAYGTDIVKVNQNSSAITSPIVPLNEDGKLLLSFYYKSANAYQMRIWAIEYDAEGNAFAGNNGNWIYWYEDNKTPSWTYFEKTYTKKNAEAVSVLFGFLSRGSADYSVEYAKLHCTDVVPNNLVANGHFNGDLTSWSTVDASGGSAVVMNEGGNNFLRLTHTGTTGQYRLKQNIAGLEAGASYRVTFKMRPMSDSVTNRTTTIDSGDMRVRLCGTDLYYKSTTTTKTTGVWNNFIGYIQMSASQASSGELILYNNVADAAGAIADFDDIKVEKVETGYEAIFVQNGEITTKLQTGKATPLFFSSTHGDVTTGNGMPNQFACIATYKTVDGKPVLAGLASPSGRFDRVWLYNGSALTSANFISGASDSLTITDDIDAVKLFIWDKNTIAPLCDPVLVTR